MREFFSMGGFGVFIWSAMGVALILMTLEPLFLVLKKRSLIKQIKRTNRQSTRKREEL